jgi:hypothetical protein
MMVVGSASSKCESFESMRFPTGPDCTPDQIKSNVQSFLSRYFASSPVESLGMRSYTSLT